MTLNDTHRPITGDQPDDAAPVLVDQPEPAGEKSLYDAIRDAREAGRKPIVPTWARQVRNWLALLRWFIDHAV